MNKTFSGTVRGCVFLVSPVRQNLKLFECLNGSSQVNLCPAGSERCKVSQGSKHLLLILKQVLGFIIGGNSPQMCPAFQDSELCGPIRKKNAGGD